MPFRITILEPGGLVDQTHRVATGDHAGFSYQLMSGERHKLDVTMEVLAGDTYVPTTGALLRYYESEGAREECVFAGTINEPASGWYSNEGGHACKLSVISLKTLFDNVIASPRSYFNKSPEFIFTDLVTPIIAAASEVIMLGTVRVSGVTLASFQVDGATSVNDLLNQLATLAGSNYTWDIDPTTSVPSVYFRPPDGLGLTITGAPREIEWGTLNLTQDRSNFRDRQGIRIDYTAFVPSCWCFIHPATPQTVFTLPFLPQQVISARITNQTFRALALGGLTSLPMPGNTFTVGSTTYTFVSALDNKIQWQILIATNTYDQVLNIADAINADPATAGIAFSLPTWENQQCNAEKLGGASWYVVAKRAGLQGNSIPVATATVGLTFATFPLGPGATHLDSGTDPPPGVADTTLSISTQAGTDLPTQATLLALPGQQDVVVQIPQTAGSPATMGLNPDPVPVFWMLEVQYRRLGGDIITVEDTALVAQRAALEHGSGWYQRVSSATGITDAAAGYKLALETLTTWSVIPSTVTFDSYRNFYHPVDFLFFATPVPTTSLNSIRFVIQEVNGSYIPGLDTVEPFSVKHSITAISGSTIVRTQTYLDWWRQALLTYQPGPKPTGPVIPPPQPRALTFSVFNATIGADVLDHHPLPQSYIPTQVSVTPKLSPVADLTATIFSDNVAYFRIRIPAGSPVNVPIIVDPATWLAVQPAVLPAGSIQTMDITGGDGTIDYKGVFTVRIDVQVVAA